MSSWKGGMVIRNFLYLDSDKLRSFSSQLFEGVTEQVVLHDQNATTKNTEQKGPVASGRIVGEIFAQERSNTQLRFLEDHAYTLFEEKLTQDQRVCLVPDEDPAPKKNAKSFVKATSRVRLNDFSHSVGLLRRFNEMGEAFWRVTNEPMASFGPGGPTKIANDSEARKKAAEMGFQFHQKISDAAAFLIDQNFGDLLELNMEVGKWLLSAPLKREFLRESEMLLVQKYSRAPLVEFTMLGLVTQTGGDEAEQSEIPDVKDAANLRAAMRALTLHMRTLESSFGAPLKNELIIDPIAIYAEI